MSTIEINFESEHEFFPVPSIYIDLPDCDEAVANEIVSRTLSDVTLWEDWGGIAMCVAMEAAEASDHSTLTTIRDGESSLIVNVVRGTVTVPLMNKPQTSGATLSYSAFITLVDAGIAVTTASVARALAEEAHSGS